jgi:ribose 5-phosphate isomerase B
MRLVIGGDHAGFALKGRLTTELAAWGHEVEDVGSFGPQPVDFPDLARSVGEAVVTGQAERGILVCGTGVGAAIAANKLRGVRAALCHDTHSAHQAVEHDDANVLCLGAQIVGEWLALDLLRAYLDARFAGGADYERRLRKIAALEDAGR